MSLWQRLKRLQIGFQQKKTYSSILGELPQLELTDSATQETYTHEQEISAQAVSQSNNLIKDPLYPRWILLSPREQDVTALTCLKYTNPQIAARLGISIDTVKTNMVKILLRLDVESKADLRVLFAYWDFSGWERKNNQR